MSELVLLPEDPLERRYFDEMLQGADLDPLALVQQALTIWHKTAEYPQGSYAKMLAIYANEVAKARASLPAAEEDTRWRKIENHWSAADIKNNRDGSFKSMTITFKAAQVSDEANREKLRRAFDAATRASPAMSQDSKGEV